MIKYIQNKIAQLKAWYKVYTCEHTETTTKFMCLQDRYVKTECNNCGKIQYYDI